MRKSDFALLRQMHNDLLEALKDLEACQCCVTCRSFAERDEYVTPPECRRCRHNNKNTTNSEWVWRLDRAGLRDRQVADGGKERSKTDGKRI